MHESDLILTSLVNAPALMVPLVTAIPAEILKRRPRPDKWSAHEHACHLAEVHRLFFLRLDQMLSEERPQIRPYDPKKDLRSDDELLHVDLSDALHRFEGDRRTLVERLRQLSADDWQRKADHPEYTHYSIFIMARHFALHDLHHAYIIEELGLRRDWSDAG